MATANGMRPKVGNLPPTARQMAVFRYIYNSTRDNGYQPTFRETIAALGIGSPNGLTYHLKALREKGLIDFTSVNRRAIRFLRRPDGTPFTGFADKPGS